MAGISALGPRTSFLGETGGGAAKCRKQFSPAGLDIYPKVYLRFNHFVSLFLGFVFFLLLFLCLRFLFGFSNSTRNIQMQCCWFTTRFFILWDIFLSGTGYCDIFNTVVERVVFVPIYELKKKIRNENTSKASEQTLTLKMWSKRRGYFWSSNRLKGPKIKDEGLRALHIIDATWKRDFFIFKPIKTQ